MAGQPLPTVVENWIKEIRDKKQSIWSRDIYAQKLDELSKVIQIETEKFYNERARTNKKIRR
tara:strand:- start:7937 stop:8122 length:186 start_codon:yes stop_codon:yes gene_type:complete